MKRLNIGIFIQDENEKIVSKKLVTENWKVDMEYDLKQHSSVDIRDEIASIIYKHFNEFFKVEVLKDMIDEAKVMGE